jgi:hypothetical protein
MNISLHTTIRRLGMSLAIATAFAAVAAGPALGTDRPAASFYTPQQLQEMSQSWAAKARASLDRPAASFYTPQQLQEMSESWAARARHDASLRSGSGTSFDWGDFGIGAAAMLGLVLLAIGLFAGAHCGRRSGVRARSAV